MPTLKRPPTIREIVIRSILGGREAADTIVDREELATTDRVDPQDRVTQVDLVPPGRTRQESIAFELRRRGVDAQRRTGSF